MSHTSSKHHQHHIHSFHHHINFTYITYIHLMHHLQYIHHIHPLQKFFHRSCGAFLHRICDIEVLIQQPLYRSYYTGVVESLHRSSLLGDLLASELLQDKTPTSQVLLKQGRPGGGLRNAPSARIARVGRANMW